MVGVRVDAGVERHHVNVVMVGTAVSPSGSAGPRRAPFVSDLSGRDFALLHNAGWEPRGLAFGASFVNAPRRGAGATLAQARQNVELTNYTNALYAARESAMERMQASALASAHPGWWPSGCQRDRCPSPTTPSVSPLGAPQSGFHPVVTSI